MTARRVSLVRFGIAIVAAIIVAQVAITAYAVATSSAGTDLNTPIMPDVEITEPLGLEAAATLGLEIARDWRADAALVNAGMQVDWPDDSIARPPTELPRGGWAILRFVSGQDMLTLRVDRGSGVVVETELMELSPGDAELLITHEIDFERASTASTTAILATEMAYGQSYRSACPDRRRATWISVLTGYDTGQTAWFIRYRDNDMPDRITLSVQIDWESGEIRDVLNLDPNCVADENG